MKQLPKNIVALADQAIFSGGSFLITILLAKLLGSEKFGFYSSITLFNYAAVSLLNAVIINPMQVSLDRVADKKSYLSFNFWAQVLLLIVISLVLFILLQLHFEFIQTLNKMGYVLLLYFIGFVMQDYFRKLFLAQAQIWNALLIDSITTLLTLLSLFWIWTSHVTNLSETLFYLSLAYLPCIPLSIILLQPSLKVVESWSNYLSLHYQQGKWLLFTTLTQWWASNLFIVTSGVFLGLKTLGAFRLVQSLFGVLNVLLQTLENVALPEATRLYIISSDNAKAYLKKISIKSALLFGAVLFVLFIFSKEVIVMAGGKEYAEFSFIVKGMSILYAFIFIGYPVRLSIRMLLLNKVFFYGYLLSFLFSLVSFRYLLQQWNVSGAIAGLIISQIILISYWQFSLAKKQFILWK